MNYSVSLTKLVEKMELDSLTPKIDISGISVTDTDVNRPALQLAGFYDYFDNTRVQVIGNVENAYLQTLPKEERLAIMKKLLCAKVPCIIFCRNLMPDRKSVV